MKPTLDSYIRKVEDSYKNFINSPTTGLPPLCDAIDHLIAFRAAERKRKAEEGQGTLF